MPNYNDAQGVADLLSQFDFNIISEGPGDFSPSHRKYTCEFSKPGIEPFTTTYQSNPDVHGQPTATDVFAALASDALAVDGLLVDTFADELGFEKPSQAIRAYESCHKTLDWLKNDLQLMTSETWTSRTSPARRKSRFKMPWTFPSTKPSTPMMRLWRTASFTGNT